MMSNWKCVYFLFPLRKISSQLKPSCNYTYRRPQYYEFRMLPLNCVYVFKIIHQTPLISLYNINTIFFVMDMHSVLCEDWTKFLPKI